MGISFDARKFDSRKSENRELQNVDEIQRIRRCTMEALTDNPFNYTFRIKKNSIVIAGKQSRLQDSNLKSIKIKGAFENLVLSEKHTWKTALINSITYSGRDGKLKVTEVGSSGSLGSLKDWDRLSDPKFGSKIFNGDDIIYSTKKHRTDHGIKGGRGKDQIYLYGGEDAEGGSDSDQFVVTKEAVKYLLQNKNAQDINIKDSSLSEGDKLVIMGKESDFPIEDQPLSNGRVTYNARFSNIEINFNNRQPIFAQFQEII